MSKSIIPYNASGFLLVSGAIRDALFEASARRVIEPVLNTDVIMPNLNRISEQDRIAGILNGVIFKFKLTYSIKKIGYIYGVVDALSA